MSRDSLRIVLNVLEHRFVHVLENDIEFVVSFKGFFKFDDIFVIQVFECLDFSKGDFFDDWVVVTFLELFYRDDVLN